MSRREVAHRGATDSGWEVAITNYNGEVTNLYTSLKENRTDIWSIDIRELVECFIEELEQSLADGREFEFLSRHLLTIVELLELKSRRLNYKRRNFLMRRLSQSISENNLKLLKFEHRLIVRTLSHYYLDQMSHVALTRASEPLWFTLPKVVKYKATDLYSSLLRLESRRGIIKRQRAIRIPAIQFNLAKTRSNIRAVLEGEGSYDILPGEDRHGYIAAFLISLELARDQVVYMEQDNDYEVIRVIRR